MKILHILPSIDPQGGGPMAGVRQYGEHALTHGHTLEVLTLDAPDAPFVRDFPMCVHAIGPSGGGYRYNAQLTPWLLANAAQYDCVIINGLWQYHAFGSWRALHRMKVPYFVFTHGMLDPWFKTTYPLKHLKKMLYWRWADYRVLRDASAVLFTCEEERLLARQSFRAYQAREEVVNYGAGQAPGDGAPLRQRFLDAWPQLQGKRLLVFLGRIHEKKGCDLLIDAYAQAIGNDPALQLVMAGPDQSGLVPALQQRAAALGIADRITWTGMLNGDMKWGALFASEAFVLSSHQENFGIAVAEALGCGLPVLISDKVNIWREIDHDGAGLVAPDTVAGTADMLRRWTALDAPARARMAAQAQATFEQRFTVEAMGESLMRVLERKLGQHHAGASA